MLSTNGWWALEIEPRSAGNLNLKGDKSLQTGNQRLFCKSRTFSRCSDPGNILNRDTVDYHDIDFVNARNDCGKLERR